MDRYIDKMEAIRNRMVEDIKAGNFSDKELSPYFEWVTTNVITFTADDVYEMLSYVSDRMDTIYEKHPKAFKDMETDPNDPWKLYEGFDEDKYLFSYYSYIEVELIRHMEMRVMSAREC